MRQSASDENQYIPHLNKYEKRSTQPGWLAAKHIIAQEDELQRQQDEIEHMSATKRMYESSHRPDKKIVIDKELYEILKSQADSRLYRLVKSRDYALFYDHETKYQAEQSKIQLARERSPAWNQNLRNLRK